MDYLPVILPLFGGLVVGGIIVIVLAFFPGDPMPSFEDMIDKEREDNILNPQITKPVGMDNSVSPERQSEMQLTKVVSKETGVRRRNGKAAQSSRSVALPPSAANDSTAMTEERKEEIAELSEAIFGTNDQKLIQGKLDVARKQAEAQMRRGETGERCISFSRLLDLLFISLVLGTGWWISSSRYNLHLGPIIRMYLPREAEVIDRILSKLQ